MTDRPPNRPRTTNQMCLVAAIVCAVAGCNTFEPRGSGPDSRTQVGERSRAATPTPAAATTPASHTARVGPYLFHSDFPLDTASPLFRELEDLPEQIESELRVPVGNGLIHVYLYADEDRYHAFLKAKDDKLPLRSAYFFAEPARGYGLPPQLQVYTWASPRLQTDLRHELTHALLHGTLKGVPLWLDEGLAGFFEQPAANDGVNPLHLDALRTGESSRPTPFRGDLARLEKLSQVNQMGRAEYQEAWAWVHYMLRGNPKGREVLLDHLQKLRTSPTPGLLLPKLEVAVGGDPHAGLTSYLAKLDLPAVITRVRMGGQ